jgi:hypothetical protein
VFILTFFSRFPPSKLKQESRKGACKLALSFRFVVRHLETAPTQSWARCTQGSQASATASNSKIRSTPPPHLFHLFFVVVPLLHFNEFVSPSTLTMSTLPSTSQWHATALALAPSRPPHCCPLVLLLVPCSFSTMLLVPKCRWSCTLVVCKRDSRNKRTGQVG